MVVLKIGFHRSTCKRTKGVVLTIPWLPLLLPRFPQRQSHRLSDFPTVAGPHFVNNLVVGRWLFVSLIYPYLDPRVRYE